MLTTFILSLLLGLIFSLPRLQNIIQVLRASPIGDNFFSPDIPEKLLGIVEENTIKSPLTQTDCAFWQIEVWIKTGKRTAKIFERSSAAPFTLMAEGEKIRIFPEGADLLLHNHYANIWVNGFMGNPFKYNKMDRAIMNSVREMGADFGEISEHSGVKVIENHLTAKDEVFTTGSMNIKDGMKTMHGWDQLLILSNWNEKAYLWRQVGWAAATVLIAEILGIFIFNRLPHP